MPEAVELLGLVELVVVVMESKVIQLPRVGLQTQVVVAVAVLVEMVEMMESVGLVAQESSSSDTQSNNDRIETNLGESWQV
jgi:hypothetical protein